MGKRQRKHKRQQVSDSTATIADLDDTKRQHAQSFLDTALKQAVASEPSDASRDQLQQSKFSKGICEVVSEHTRLELQAHRQGNDLREVPSTNHITAETSALLPVPGWSPDVLNAKDFNWHCETFVVGRTRQSVAHRRHFALLLRVLNQIVSRFGAYQKASRQADALDGGRTALVWFYASVHDPPEADMALCTWKPTQHLFRLPAEGRRYAPYLSTAVRDGFLWIARWVSWDAKSTMFVRVRPSWIKKICEHCSRGVCTQPGRKQCAQCRCASYCSRERQMAHWPTHKPQCAWLAQVYPIFAAPSATARGLTLLIGEFCEVV